MKDHRKAEQKSPNNPGWSADEFANVSPVQARARFVPGDALDFDQSARLVLRAEGKEDGANECDRHAQELPSVE